MTTRDLLRTAVVLGLAAASALATGCGRGRTAYRPTERPPATRVGPVTETLHGVAVTDDYRWLEGASNPDGSNPGQMSPEVAAWTDAQRRYTRSVLDAVPERAEVQSRLAELTDAGDLSVPMIGGNRYFFWQRHPGDPYPTVYTRDGALGSDRALIRPADLDPAALTRVGWIVPSPDGKLLAFGTYRSGDTDAACACSMSPLAPSCPWRFAAARAGSTGFPTAAASSTRGSPIPPIRRATSSCSTSSVAIPAATSSCTVSTHLPRILGWRRRWGHSPRCRATADGLSSVTGRPPRRTTSGW
jgi:hypothetical protein